MSFSMLRSMTALAFAVAAMIVPPAFGGGSCPSDINNDSVVSGADLVAVLDDWGPCDGSCPADISGNGVVNAADLFAIASDWGLCAGSDMEAPHPLTFSDEIELHDGDETIAYKMINGVFGIKGANDDNVGRLVVKNCTINSIETGIYLGSCDEVRLNNVHIKTGSGEDDYTLRGTIARYTSRNCSFTSNGKSWRVYNLTECGSSTDDVIVGGIMWVGGGPADGWQNQLPFRDFTFTRTRIRASSVEIMAQTHDVTFNNCDFAGTDHISIHGPAHDITFNNCDNLPEIREYGNPYNIVVNP